jgi:hypothetical protein
MLRKISLTVCAAVVLSCTTARASDWTEPGGGVFAQIMDQGGAYTTITLINLDAVPAAYTLKFFDDNGNPLTLSTTAGTGSSFSGTLPVNGSIIIDTIGSAIAPLVQGYAVLVTNNSIAGSAVFGLPIRNQIFESTSPLDTGVDYKFGIPFDHTTPGTVVGVALANDYGYTPLNITVAAYDENGIQIVASTISMQQNTHTAFLLTSQFPALQNVKGTIWFTGVPFTDAKGVLQQEYFNVLGVRATTSTYTSIVPIVPAGF